MSESRDGQIPRRDAVVACTVAGVLAAILMAIILIGSDIPMRCYEGGNAADWLAACGTWVIGYGAWKIARDSHQHRVDEYQVALRDKRDERRVRIWRMKEAAINASVLHSRLSDFSNKLDGERTVRTLRSVFRVAHKVLGSIALSDEDRTLLPADAIEELGRFEFELMFNLDLIQSFLERSAPPARQTTAISEDELSPYLEAAETFRASADALLDVLDDLPDELTI